MIIKDRNSTDYFELHIDGFQFEDPEKLHGDDLEWLMITIRSSREGRTWITTHPCLEYSSAKILAEWLCKIANGEVPHKKGYYNRELSFLEPNIRFKLMGRSMIEPVVRVYIDNESRPSWAPMDYSGKNRQSLYIDLTTDAETLIEASRSLIEELARLPERERGLSRADGHRVC